jgi:hypothetical protein
MCHDATVQEMALPIGRNYTRDKADDLISKIIPKIWTSGGGAEFAIKPSKDAGDGMGAMVGVSDSTVSRGSWPVNL